METFKTLLLMAVLAVFTLGVGALLLAADITAAGWALLVVGMLAVLITLSHAIKQ
jgi:hypothetical protein